MSSSEHSVDVLICTFRRDSLAETLVALDRQELPPGISLRAIVADNDTTPSGQALTEQVAAGLSMPILYIHAPERNISLARNATLAAATARWVAFVDDDEVPDPRWISSLLAKAEESGAEVILGPVVPLYGDGAPSWLVEGDFLATTPTMREGDITEGYTCNALLRRDCAASEGQKFDLALGRSGGEDTEFFDRLKSRGARFAYAPDAVVTERVPKERTRLSWLLRRRYRFGQTHGRLIGRRATGPVSRLGAIGLASSKVAVCVAGAAINIARPSQRAYWLLRAALHGGVVSRLLGHSEIVQYGSDEPRGTRPDA